ncbi:hypothetical protein F5Y19DRAFT_396032 [Xylariaceae sp. FL1651]|nr:hypothetical protein F5Y19DRAFT_396032 [Xylariaceae sp. FL1651]
MANSGLAHGGWNPSFGWDGMGGPPCTGQGHGNTMPTAMPYGAFGAGGGFPGPSMPGYSHGQAPGFGWPPYGYNGHNGHSGLNGYYPNQRMPQPHPRVSFDVPGMNIVNSTGGAGCEPGYNYIFHSDHTKVHVFKSSKAPWETSGMNVSFAKFHIPTNTTIGELMVRFGATNACARKNRITEVIESGNGTWYSGVVLEGDQESEMKKTLKDIGWDGSRTGRERPVVWLWITKD